MTRWQIVEPHAWPHWIEVDETGVVVDASERFRWAIGRAMSDLLDSLLVSGRDFGIVPAGVPVPHRPPEHPRYESTP